jgi:dolichyl-phosphate-mannose--protein O-mannosyl transferase
MTPFAWRLPGALFGIFMIPLIYAFARLLFKSNNYAFFAAFIFSFDFMLYSHSRLATIDTFVVFFVLAMYFLMYMYTRKPSLITLALCGASMGLAIASKWQGIYGAIGLPILFFPALWKIFLRDKKYAIITFASCFGFFIALPILIYILSYIPFVNAQGGGGLRTIWDNQINMFNYHSFLDSWSHPFASQWWEWPLITRPLFQYQCVFSETVRAGMSSLGSPAVWWVGIPATVFAIYSLAKKRRHEHVTIFLLVAYAANFLPWVFSPRETYIYHYFPSVPFVVLLIVLVFRYHIKRDVLCFAYAGVVFALFIIYFPVLSGLPVTTDYLNILRGGWLPAWWPDWLNMFRGWVLA